jgi:hypothetical protein
MRRIYRTEGVYGFYRGMVPSLFGVTHVAVQFPLYEHFKKLNRAFRKRHSGRKLMCVRQARQTAATSPRSSSSPARPPPR